MSSKNLKPTVDDGPGVSLIDFITGLEGAGVTVSIEDELEGRLDDLEVTVDEIDDTQAEVISDIVAAEQSINSIREALQIGLQVQREMLVLLEAQAKEIESLRFRHQHLLDGLYSRLCALEYPPSLWRRVRSWWAS